MERENDEENTAWCPRCIEDWTDEWGREHKGRKVVSECDECGVCSECEHLLECSHVTDL